MIAAMDSLLIALAASVALSAAVLAAGRSSVDSRYWSIAQLLVCAPLAVALFAPLLAEPAAPLTAPLLPIFGVVGDATDASGGSSAGVQGVSLGLEFVSLLGVVWSMGAAGRAVLEVMRSVRLAGITGRTRAAPAPLRARLDALAAQTGVVAPRLVLSDGAGPLTAGLVRPVIVIPHALLQASALDSILRHELEHQRRGDLVALTFARVGGIVFWFNPFWFAVERRRRIAAEIACDRAALSRSDSGDARSYARALLDASRADSGPHAALGFGVAPKDALRMRLSDLLSPAPKSSASALAMRLAAVVLLATPLGVLQVAEAASIQPAPVFTHTVVEGRTTSGFGPRVIPGMNVPPFHTGHDIAAPIGTPVRAPAAGRVTYAGDLYREQESWGRVVEIDHGGGWITIYAHLDEHRVSEGESVRAGSVIATVGDTGLATGPHLHVEVVQDGVRLDPVDHLPGLQRRDG